jgi:hypothetical protein
LKNEESPNLSINLETNEPSPIPIPVTSKTHLSFSASFFIDFFKYNVSDKIYNANLNIVSKSNFAFSAGPNWKFDDQTSLDLQFQLEYFQLQNFSGPNELNQTSGYLTQTHLNYTYPLTATFDLIASYTIGQNLFFKTESPNQFSIQKEWLNGLGLGLRHLIINLGDQDIFASAKARTFKGLIFNSDMNSSSWALEISLKRTKKLFQLSNPSTTLGFERANSETLYSKQDERKIYLQSGFSF